MENRVGFSNKNSGKRMFKPLVHKGTKKPLKDIEYFELLGKRCLELDAMNTNPHLATDYGEYDKSVVEVAKNVALALKEGVDRHTVELYVARCIEI